MATRISNIFVDCVPRVGALGLTWPASENILLRQKKFATEPRQIEGLVGRPLCDHFHLIYGTSTGSIIGSLLGLGYTVNAIRDLYEEHVVKIVSKRSASQRSAALADLAATVFGDQKFDAFKTQIGIVSTKWVVERPMIFKTSVAQAYGSKETFEPGFGCTIGDAVEASCSAYPFFNRKKVTTGDGDVIELMDGGYCANNPTLYAIADARVALGVRADKLRIVSIGVREYPPIKTHPLEAMWWISRVPSVKLLQKTMEINTQSMDQLRAVLFDSIKTVRVSERFPQPEMATDLFESSMTKLNILRQRGKESYANKEADLKGVLLEG